MPEKDTIFSSSTKYRGIFAFKDLYKFCYTWLMEETGLDFITENKYVEKLSGDEKDIEVEWNGEKKVTDYFKYKLKIEFIVNFLTEVEVIKEGVKIKTNKGQVQIKVKGDLVRDYEGKFEQGAFKKFLRAIYEKWVIPARIEQFEEKLAGKCEEFVAQAKAYLDLEGKR